MTSVLFMSVYFFFCSSRRRHTRCALVTGVQTCALPIFIADQPFFRSLDLDLSARVADYDIGTVGTVLTYRGGLSWRPVDDLQFRVQYARAERAPDLTELFSPPRGDTDSGIADPCDGVDADTPGALGANCRADRSEEHTSDSSH